jgi:hypothetical protein
MRRDITCIRVCIRIFNNAYYFLNIYRIKIIKLIILYFSCKIFNFILISYYIFLFYINFFLKINDRFKYYNFFFKIHIRNPYIKSHIHQHATYTLCSDNARWNIISNSLSYNAKESKRGDGNSVASHQKAFLARNMRRPNLLPVVLTRGCGEHQQNYHLGSNCFL